MNDRNLVNSFNKRIKNKASGWSKRNIQRASYVAVFAVVLSVVTVSYVTADSGAQVSLPSVSTTDNLSVNLLQGQKVDQINTANAVAASAAKSSGGDLGGAVKPSSQAATAGDVKAANVAYTIASTVGLSSSNSVSSSAESANLGAKIAQSDATSINKQQLVEPSEESSAISTYTTVQGDTMANLTTKYGISSQTIRWANKLKDDNIAVGANLLIPAVDGVVYTFKEGDSLQSIADKYKSNTQSIVEINDLDDSEKVAVGTVLLLPDGILPEAERPEYVAPVVNTSSNSYGTLTTDEGLSSSVRSSLSAPNVVGNNYAYGYCTYYAYNRRAQMGLPAVGGWGNANTWDDFARASGFVVNGTPSVGAILQTDAGWYGHVGVVEAVNPDGSIRVSEMNYSGWNVVSERTIRNLSGYKFIH